MERPRDPFELILALRDEVADLRATVGELRATVTHLTSDMAEVKQDIRRLDDRFFQMTLLQLGTLATALAALIANLAS